MKASEKKFLVVIVAVLAVVFFAPQVVEVFFDLIQSLFETAVWLGIVFLVVLAITVWTALDYVFPRGGTVIIGDNNIVDQRKLVVTQYVIGERGTLSPEDQEFLGQATQVLSDGKGKNGR